MIKLDFIIIFIVLAFAYGLNAQVNSLESSLPMAQTKTDLEKLNKDLKSIIISLVTEFNSDSNQSRLKNMLKNEASDNENQQEFEEKFNSFLKDKFANNQIKKLQPVLFKRSNAKKVIRIGMEFFFS